MQIPLSRGILSEQREYRKKVYIKLESFFCIWQNWVSIIIGKRKQQLRDTNLKSMHPSIILCSQFSWYRKRILLSRKLLFIFLAGTEILHKKEKSEFFSGEGFHLTRIVIPYQRQMVLRYGWTTLAKFSKIFWISRFLNFFCEWLCNMLLGDEK